MQVLNNSRADGEIDLRELFASLWAHKLLIACTCALGILSSGYYIQQADKEFTSTAIFKLNDQSNGFSFGQNFQSLASLAGYSGIGGGQTANSISKEQVLGRIFIEKLDAKLNLQADSYFNSYDPKSVDSVWKSKIKQFIGWKQSNADTQEIIWQKIIQNYSEAVTLHETDNASIKIMVTHINPKRAANIANGIMNQLISNARQKNIKEQDNQLSYLSNTLAKALRDLELSQSKLKEFTLENSALPKENFITGSFQLDYLREQLTRTSELHEAVAALSLLQRNKTTNQKSYQMLRQQFPIVDEVEFRRIMGQNEILNTWIWPKASTVNGVFDTLSDRKIRLQSQINATQVDAERSSMALEAYAKLEREAKISEATYTVLIEQVKAQSVIAGFIPDKTEIYEFASASLNPSAPRTTLILATGAILGLFLGIAFSLVLAIRSGVYFSKNALSEGAQARLSKSVKTLLPLRNKNLTKINKILLKKPHSVLRDMAVEINKSGFDQVVLTSMRSKLQSNDAAQALACYMQSDTMKIAIIDFSSNVKKLHIGNERLPVGSFVIDECVENVSILKTDGNLKIIELLAKKGFWDDIKALNSTFDLVFLCADNSDAVSILSALEGQKIFHISLARTKKTKSATLEQMISHLPIQGLLYD